MNYCSEIRATMERAHTLQQQIEERKKQGLNSVGHEQ
jgi:hypothetical protein